jgi:hypothetical protein
MLVRTGEKRVFAFLDFRSSNAGIGQDGRHKTLRFQDLMIGSIN